MDIKQLLIFSDRDFELIVEGVSCLKNKDMAGELMSGMMEAMLIKKPKDDASEEEKRSYTEMISKREKEKAEKEEKDKIFAREIDILKAKLILIKEMKDRNDFIRNSKKLKSRPE